jgi:asparagine synthase (glutamine-hydrolysing)
MHGNGLLDNRRHKTFSSWFDEKGYDESPFIEDVVKKTGADSYRVSPDPEALIREIDRLIWHQDEPFASTSIYAQWNVFKLACSQQTKVILDGQGADEMLGGYHPLFGAFLAELLNHGRLLDVLKEIQAFRGIHMYSYKWILSHLLGFFVKTERINRISRPLIARKRFSWLRDQKHLSAMIPASERFPGRPFLNRLYHLMVGISLPALLHYEDRNSMAHSIEARVPFLDHRLVEFVFSLPPAQILRNGVTKVILRDAMDGILPTNVRNRMDKMGFETPQDIWFRSHLRDWIHNILRSRTFQERDYLHPSQIEEEFDLHCAGKKNISFTIWRWVNLELWFRRFIDQTSVG